MDPPYLPIIYVRGFAATMGEIEGSVATMLEDGRFDVSALDQERLTEILSNLHALRNGDRIVLQPDSNH